MPGLKIVLDTDEAARASRRLKGDLKTLGHAAVENEADFKKLEDRMKKGMEADKASDAMGRMTKALHLTRLETIKFYRDIGDHKAMFKTMASGLDGVTSKLLSTKAIITGLFAGGATAAGVVTLKNAFKDFESALTDMSKVTDIPLEKIREEIMKMDPVLGDATAMVQGYYQTISAGITDPVKSLDFLTDASKTSKAAHVEQGEVVKALSKLMAGYAGEVETAADAADLLFAIEKEGQTNVAELVPVIGDLAAISHEVGVRQTEMAGALSLITQTSGSTSEAATKYKAILVGLYKPQSEMQKLLESTGYSSGVAMVKQLGLAGALEKIKNEARKTGTGLGKLFESQEALIGISALSANNFQTLAKKERAVADGAGGMEKAFKKWQGTMDATESVFNNTIKRFMIEFGNDLAPAMQTGMEDFTNYLNDHKTEILGFFDGIGTKAKASVEHLKGIADGLSGIKGVYDAMPEDLIGPAGVGIVGAILFGPKAGLLLAGGTYLLDKQADFLEALKGVQTGVISVEELTSGLEVRDAALKRYKQLESGIKKVTKAINEQTEGYGDYVKASSGATESVWDGVRAAQAYEGALAELPGWVKKYEDQATAIIEKSTKARLKKKKKALEEYKSYEEAKPEIVQVMQAEVLALEDKFHAEEKRKREQQLKELQDIEVAAIDDLKYEKPNLTDKERRMLVDPDLVQKTEEILDERQDAIDDALDDEERAYERHLEKMEDAYDDFHDSLRYGIREAITDWEDFGTTLVTIFENAMADIAAEAIATPFLMPLDGAPNIFWKGGK